VGRVEGDRAAVGLHGGLEPAVLLEDDAQVAVPVRLVRAEREAALDERDCVFLPSLLMREDTRVVQRAGMIGGHVEHSSIQFPGRLQVTRSLRWIAARPLFEVSSRRSPAAPSLSEQRRFCSPAGREGTV
jgi:hypothetical protein